jgi:hypothetical protein
MGAATFNTCECGWSKAEHTVSTDATKAKALAHAQATAALFKSGPGTKIFTKKGWMQLEDVVNEMQASVLAEKPAPANNPTGAG